MKITIIGAGNIGGAIARGLVRGALDYERQSVVSVAAGIPFERLLRYFTKDAVTRYLPCC